ncbi:unnamed protein product [Trichobilharzia regenti]|nr:unnamed protein product [Trichobilharzia regenti]
MVCYVYVNVHHKHSDQNYVLHALLIPQLLAINVIQIHYVQLYVNYMYTVVLSQYQLEIRQNFNIK